MAADVVFTSSLDADGLLAYVERLLANYLPDGTDPRRSLLPYVHDALAAVEHCFTAIHRKYYNLNDSIEFNHLNGDHFATFLYYLSNFIWKATGEEATPTKLFYLNKIMHGLDLFFSVELPPVFLLVHPVGTVIGNAHYGDYLVIYQNCTIGADAGVYPRFGTGTVLYSRTSVLGNSTIGDNVVFAANSFVVNSDIPSDSIVVGQYPHHRVLDATRSVRDRLFDAPTG